MTLVMAWLNKQEDPTSLNIASDSLLSDGKGVDWQYASKIFRVFPTHNYIAYCGSSLLALSSILQATAVLSNSNTLGKNADPNLATIARCRALCTFVSEAVKTFPRKWLADPPESTLLYCGFDFPTGRFQAFEVTLGLAGAKCKQITLQQEVLCFGSGKKHAQKLLGSNTSRKEILGVLSKLIESSAAPTVGGVPQMVSIQKSTSTPIGFNWPVNGGVKSTLFGAPLHFRSDPKKINFLDRHFRTAQYLGCPKMRRMKP
jgi:hypothetical protein